MKRISIRAGLGLLFYSGFYRLVELSNYFLIFRALGVEVPYVSVIFLGAIVMFAGEIPITFLGLGTREVAVMFLFLPFAPVEKLLAAGVLMSFVEYILPNVIGIFFTKRFLDKMV